MFHIEVLLVFYSLNLLSHNLQAVLECNGMGDKWKVING